MAKKDTENDGVNHVTTEYNKEKKCEVILNVITTAVMSLDHIMVLESRIRLCFLFSEKEKWGVNINDITFC